jgi:hypothetical protein
MLDGVPVGGEAPDGAAQLVAVGIHERDVVEARVPGGGRRGARALERVERDVVVVVARGEEGGVDAGRPAIGDDAEAERVAVEGDRAVEVGHLEVDVADVDPRVDRRRGAVGRGVHG